jgi:energy-coupling factor transport system permease protein
VLGGLVGTLKLAGLLRPTAGSCELNGQPTHRQIGGIGLAFQHSRLQVQRPTVGADIAEAAGWTDHAGAGRPHTPEDPELAQRVAAALARVGLPPELAGRPVDQLSGGQLRRLPREGRMHRMWVGSKLAVLVLLTVATLLRPSWAQLAATALVVLLAVISARVPLSAVPRFPWWFWLTLAIGLVVAAVGNGTAHYVQLVCLSTLLMVLSAVVAWTTDLGDLAPAVRALGAPLRRIRLPVDEWALTTTLCVRSLPLIIDECRTLIAARRLRPRVRGVRPEAWARSLVDLLTAMMAVTIRRATDMGEAITVRGGDAKPPGRPIRVSWTDAVAVAIVAATCAAPAALGA